MKQKREVCSADGCMKYKDLKFVWVTRDVMDEHGTGADDGTPDAREGNLCPRCRATVALIIDQTDGLLTRPKERK